MPLTSVYLVGVAASPGPGAVIRWLVLLCVVTAATVGVVGAVAKINVQALGPASLYWVSVFSFILWTVPSAWIVRSRYARFAARSDGRLLRRLERLPVPSVPPHRCEEAGDEPGSVPTDCPGNRLLIETAVDRAPATAVPVPEPPTKRRPMVAEAVVPDRDAVAPNPAPDHSPPPNTLRLSSPHELRTESPLDRVPEAANAEPAGPDPDERNRGARELAEILNLYDRVGLTRGDDTDSPGLVPYRASSAPGERTLWGELVEDFGAASIDFRGDESGECWITLATGDLVFYAPERECWMWIVFEAEEDVPSSPAESPPSFHIVADPS